MTHYIFARVRNKRVWFVGCSRTADLPVDAILLQEVEHHPQVCWVKWSLRFAATLEEKTALAHPYTKYFKNSVRLTRLLEDKDLAAFSAEQNAAFLKFHHQNSHLLSELVEAALTKKTEGWREYSTEQLLGNLRWSDTEVDREDDRVKLNARWSAWYSRMLQMTEPRLIGFFSVRLSIADGLVLADGRSWQEFASEHEDKLRYEQWDNLPDTEWEY